MAAPAAPDALVSHHAQRYEASCRNYGCAVFALGFVVLMLCFCSVTCFGLAVDALNKLNNVLGRLVGCSPFRFVELVAF